MAEPTLRQSGAGVTARTIALTATAGSHLWVAGELGPHSYGAFALALFLQGAVGLLANLGIASAVSYRIAQEPHSASSVIRAGLLLASATMALALPASWLAMNTTGVPAASELGPLWVSVALATVPLRLLQEVLTGALTGLGRLSLTFCLYSAAPSYLVLALVAARITGPLDSFAVMGALLASHAAAACLAVALVAGSIPRSALGTTTLLGAAQVLRLFSLGWQQTLNLGAWWTLARLNRALVAGFAGLDGTGRFAVGASIAEMLTYIPSAIQLSLFSRLARLRPADSGASVRTAMKTAIKLVAVGALLVGVVAVALLERLLGTAYADVSLILIALLPGTVALTPVGIIGAYFLAGRGRPWLNLLPTIAAITTLVPAVLVLGSWWGLVGAAIGTSVAYSTAAAVALLLYRSDRSAMRRRDAKGLDGGEIRSPGRGA